MAATHLPRTQAMQKFVASIVRSFTSARDLSEPTEWDSQWMAAARELGLDTKASVRRRPVRMDGHIDGHRVKVRSSHLGQPKIEVDFVSGLGQLDIKRRRPGRDEARGLPVIATGDPVFDSTYYFFRSQNDQDVLLQWLNQQRRDVLVTLAEALDVDEIEENEIEARMPVQHWSSSELVEAVRLCVLVATVLDVSHRPPDVQDAIVQDAVIQDARTQ